MNANELRIGNLIVRNYDEKHQEIDKITGYDLWHSEKINEINHFIEWKVIEPIPLTEEWLLKFGFKKDDKSFWKHWLNYYLELTNFGAEYWYPIYAEVPELSGNDEQRIHLTCIQYVHQLQNLYFALTGEELTLSE